ncbi:MAG: SagB/ThcOx family dehydrogenase [Nitrospirae bacterium]|nr:SagB/ThcOx family dehydrogenase [Nitrospirota bacterium]
MTARNPTISERFHEETKYAEGDMDKFAVPPLTSGPPEPFKDYHTEQAVNLIGYLPFDRHPFTGGPLPDTRPDATEAGLYGLSRLLFFTNGVTGIMPMQHGTHHYFRAAPSAGGLYPTEIYLAVRNLPDLADGIYNYQVRDHSLAPVWEGGFWARLGAATCANGALEQANAALLFTGCWSRGTWRYRDRAYRRALLDTGHVLGNLTVIGPTCGYGVFPIGGFLDAAINNLLFVDDTEEGALLIAALPRLESLNLDQAGGGTALPSPASHGVAPDPNDPLLHQLHRAGYVTDPDTCVTARRAFPDTRDHGFEDADEVIALEHEPIDFGADGGVERTILARRSARQFARAGISLAELGALLSYAYQPTLPMSQGNAPSRQMFDPTLLDSYLIVNRSGDLAPGIYYYAPGRHELRLMRAGDLGDAARHICLGQDLGGDAACLVIHTADLDEAIQRYGDRAYRYLHLDAGHIGQRLNLGALPLGLGASGIGGFYDDAVSRLLALPDSHLVAYITTIGHSGSDR